MTVFQRRFCDDSQTAVVAKDLVLLWQREPAKVCAALGLAGDATEAEVKKRGMEVWKEESDKAVIMRNDLYQVAIYHDPPPRPGWPNLIHLSIKRIDRQPIHDWRELQEIKNSLLGNETEAVELYPAQSRVADLANQYHLWALGDLQKWPIGFKEGFICDAIEGSVSQQRKL
jgi:hypothetical protein